MTKPLTQILNGENGIVKTNELESKYAEVRKIEPVDEELYLVEEYDSKKGVRVSYINPKTGKTLLQKRMCE